MIKFKDIIFINNISLCSKEPTYIKDDISYLDYSVSKFINIINDHNESAIIIYGKLSRLKNDFEVFMSIIQSLKNKNNIYILTSDKLDELTILLNEIGLLNIIHLEDNFIIETEFGKYNIINKKGKSIQNYCNILINPEYHEIIDIPNINFVFDDINSQENINLDNTQWVNNLNFNQFHNSICINNLGYYNLSDELNLIRIKEKNIFLKEYKAEDSIINNNSNFIKLLISDEELYSESYFNNQIKEILDNSDITELSKSIISNLFSEIINNEVTEIFE